MEIGYTLAYLDEETGGLKMLTEPMTQVQLSHCVVVVGHVHEGCQLTALGSVMLRALADAESVTPDEPDEPAAPGRLKVIKGGRTAARSHGVAAGAVVVEQPREIETPATGVDSQRLPGE